MDGLFWTSLWHWWERVNNTVIEFQLSVTSGSSRAQIWTACLVDRDANDYAISPPPIFIDINLLCTKTSGHQHLKVGINMHPFVTLDENQMVMSQLMESEEFLSYIHVKWTLRADLGLNRVDSWEHIRDKSCDGMTATWDCQPCCTNINRHHLTNKTSCMYTVFQV